LDQQRVPKGLRGLSGRRASAALAVLVVWCLTGCASATGVRTASGSQTTDAQTQPTFSGSAPSSAAAMCQRLSPAEAAAILGTPVATRLVASEAKPTCAFQPLSDGLDTGKGLMATFYPASSLRVSIPAYFARIIQFDEVDVGPPVPVHGLGLEAVCSEAKPTAAIPVSLLTIRLPDAIIHVNAPSCAMAEQAGRDLLSMT
jgi:hypothetical protein